MTSPVEFPMHGKFKKRELSKEELIEFWKRVLNRADFKCRTGEKVENIARMPTGYSKLYCQGQFRARHVILALGKSAARAS